MNIEIRLEFSGALTINEFKSKGPSSDRRFTQYRARTHYKDSRSSEVRASLAASDDAGASDVSPLRI